MNRIIFFSFLLAGSSIARPWYEFVDNANAAQTILELRVEQLDRVTKATVIYEHAVTLDDFITRNEQNPSLSMQRVIKATEDEMVSLLIKASDLGNRQAKMVLSFILQNGECGVDPDLDFAKRLAEEVENNLPYLEPKPWDMDFELNHDDQNFIDGLKKAQQTDQPKEVLAFDYALNRLASKQRARDTNFKDYVALLAEASKLGSLNAKKMLVSILCEGSFGVERDVPLASIINLDIMIEDMLAVLPETEARLVESYLENMRYFYYNKNKQHLTLWDQNGAHHFFRAKAKLMHDVISYHNNRKSFFKNFSDVFSHAYYLDNGVDLNQVD